MRFTSALWRLLLYGLVLAIPSAWAADVKISALTAAGSAAGANEYEINEAGTPKKVTGTQIQTFVNTAPVYAAGTASANTWPKYTAGTVLTTPEAGALEYATGNFFLTTDAGNRGYVPVRHFIRADATRTLPNDTNENAIFNAPTNGRLTLETGTYLFEGIIAVTSMSATTGNASLDILGAGTATVGAWLWHVVGVDGSSATAATQTGSWIITQQSPASAVTAGTGTSMLARMRGTFEVTGAGTLIPSIDQVTAAAAIVSVGSYIMFERVANATNAVSLGQWD